MKNVLLTIGLFMAFLVQSLFAAICPDPANSSLQWGEIPAPWINDPFSANVPQADMNTRFVRANIMVAAGVGRGVVCTYHNSLGDYSIWWSTYVKIPSRNNDSGWIDTAAGFVCTESLAACQFVGA